MVGTITIVRESTGASNAHDPDRADRTWTSPHFDPHRVGTIITTRQCASRLCCRTQMGSADGKEPIMSKHSTQ